MQKYRLVFNHNYFYVSGTLYITSEFILILNYAKVIRHKHLPSILLCVSTTFIYLVSSIEYFATSITPLNLVYHILPSENMAKGGKLRRLSPCFLFLYCFARARRHDNVKPGVRGEADGADNEPPSGKQAAGLCRTERKDSRGYGSVQCAFRSDQGRENSMAEIAVLEAQIINYAKTRAVFGGCKASGYSGKYPAEHEADILLHKAAEKAFDEPGLKKLSNR